MACPTKLLGMGLLGASVLSAIPMHQDGFEEQLSESQRILWKHIQYERFSIYLTSLFVSLLVARAVSTDKWIRVVLAITLAASLYMVTPKSVYMADFLTPDQIELLRQRELTQRTRYYGSVTLAIFAIPFVC